MIDVSKICDVFISHSASDAQVAAEVAQACRANGLAAVTNSEFLPSENGSDALRETLAESRALLAILSPSGLTPSMAIELGAAWAWNKPVFAIATDPAFTRLPPGLSGIQLYTPGRIEDIIRIIKKSSQELSEGDRALLAKRYTKLGVSVDQLALEPGQLGELVNGFNADTGKAVPGERLLSELLRMRKQGKLTRGRTPDRTKKRKGPA